MSAGTWSTPAPGATARVAFGGAIHEARPDAGGLLLDDGRRVSADAVVWLPPFEPGTVIALGLN